MPSNAPPGWPKQSPEGYDYFYALDGNGQPAHDNAGHLLRSLMYDSQNFPDIPPGQGIVDLRDHQRRVPMRDDALRELDAGLAVMMLSGDVLGVPGLARYPVGSLNDADRMYLFKREYELLGAGNDRGNNLAYAVLSGARSQVATDVIKWADEHRELMWAFVTASYEGPLKPLVEAYLAH